VKKISRSGSTLLSLTHQSAGDVLWDGSSIWISLQDLGALWRLDPSSGSDTAKVPACSGSMPSLVYDGLSVWVACADAGAVVRLTPDSAKGSFTQSIYPVGGRPVQLEFDGASVWVANEATGAFQRLSNERETVEETFVYPGATKALLLRFGGAFMWGVVRTENQTVLLKF
jgi:streptogramin lyase